MRDSFRKGADVVVDAARFAASRGWTPATSGNFSLRVDRDHILITESGADKGALTVDQILVVDRDGRAVDNERCPSAETALHWEAYDRDPTIGAVVHTHSVLAAVLSREVERSTLTLEGYEILKAFFGVHTHLVRLSLPIVENEQDTAVLARAVRAVATERDLAPGYLIRGHGAYVWGRDMREALRHTEALEYLLACVAEERRIRS